MKNWPLTQWGLNDYKQGVDLSASVFLNNLNVKYAIIKSASFTGALLERSTFSSSQIFLTNFRNASLKWATFADAEITGTNFQASNLYFADFYNAEVYASDFRNSAVKFTNFQNSTLTGSTFHGVDLGCCDRNVNCPKDEEKNDKYDKYKCKKFRGAKLSRTHDSVCLDYLHDSGSFPVNDDDRSTNQYLFYQQQEPVNFSNAILSGLDLSNMDLHSVDFTSSILHGTNFSNSDLDHSNFSNADITDAIFLGANITGANFSGIRQFPEGFLSACISRDRKYPSRKYPKGLPKGFAVDKFSVCKQSDKNQEQ